MKIFIFSRICKYCYQLSNAVHSMHLPSVSTRDTAKMIASTPLTVLFAVLEILKTETAVMISYGYTNYLATLHYLLRHLHKKVIMTLMCLSYIFGSALFTYTVLAIYGHEIENTL